MNDITYGIVKETYSLGTAERISYGIAVYSNTEHIGTACVIASLHDVSSEKEKIADLVSLCNRHHLAPEHLTDVISDFLNT